MGLAPGCPTSSLLDVMRCASHPSLRAEGKKRRNSYILKLKQTTVANKNAFHTLYLNTLLAWEVSEEREKEEGNHICHTHTHTHSWTHFTHLLYTTDIYTTTHTEPHKHRTVWHTTPHIFRNAISRYYYRWKVIEQRRQILYGITVMCNLKKKKKQVNITTTKKTKLTGIENKLMVTSGEREERGVI